MKSLGKARNKTIPPLDSEGEQGLVSVIVPTYNRAYCVTKSIDSALTQTYRDLEVIVIDDGSSDNTNEVVTNAYANEPRVRYVYQANGGVAAARNHGIRLARGEFIALLDSDDMWKPWKTELQVKVLHDWPELGMAWTDMEAVNPQGQVIATRFLRTMYGAYQWFPTYESLFSVSGALPSAMVSQIGDVAGRQVYIGNIFSSMMIGNLVHTSTVLIRRERLVRVGFFHENFKMGGEDYDFHLRTCYEGPVGFVDVSSIYYRVGCHDQFTVGEVGIHFAIANLRAIHPYLQAHDDRLQLSKTMIRMIQARVYGWIGETLLDRGKRKVACRFLAQSLRYQFWQPRKLIMLIRATMPAWVDTLALKGYRAVKRAIKPAAVEALR